MHGAGRDIVRKLPITKNNYLLMAVISILCNGIAYTMFILKLIVLAVVFIILSILGQQKRLRK
jgi:hypothetical protein